MLHVFVFVYRPLVVALSRCDHFCLRAVLELLELRARLAESAREFKTIRDSLRKSEKLLMDTTSHTTSLRRLRTRAPVLATRKVARV